MTIAFLGQQQQRTPILPELRKSLVGTSDERAARPGAQRPSRNRSAAAVALAVVAAIALTTGFVVGGQDEAQTRSSSPSRADRPPSAAAQSEVRMEFAVFQASPTESARNLFDLFGAEVGNLDLQVDPADARRLDIGVAEVWAAPAVQRGRPAACIKARSTVARGVITGTCASLDSARTAGLWMTTRPAPGEAAPGTIEAVGLVPDGTAAVTFLEADGSRTRVQPSDNAVAKTFEKRPKGVEVVTRDGDVVRTPL